VYLYQCECVHVYVDICICISVTNSCSSVALYLYMYTACDVFCYCFITIRGRPSWSFSLRALYSASGLHHSTDSLVIYHVYMCARLVLISCAGTYSTFGLTHFSSYPIGIGLASFGFCGSWECAQTVRSFSSAW